MEEGRGARVAGWLGWLGWLAGCLVLDMETRRRGERKPERHAGITRNGASAGKAVAVTKRSSAGGTERSEGAWQPGTTLGAAWCWHGVTMATGLSLAGALGMFHAWAVNSIHENLLWFSNLEVRNPGGTRGTAVGFVQFSQQINVLIFKKQKEYFGEISRYGLPVDLQRRCLFPLKKLVSHSL